MRCVLDGYRFVTGAVALVDTWTDSMFRRAGSYWRLHWNTRAIASALQVDESECWNRLDQIKALARAG